MRPVHTLPRWLLILRAVFGTGATQRDAMVELDRRRVANQPTCENAMSNYIRVLPRDLFNEASLLKCYGRLWILLDEMRDHCAAFVTEDADAFDIAQDEASGSIYVQNIDFQVMGISCRLTRPLNSRSSWPLYVEDMDERNGFDPVPVFDDNGNLSVDMMTLIAPKG
jgi:hypothetical protein